MGNEYTMTTETSSPSDTLANCCCGHWSGCHNSSNGKCAHCQCTFYHMKRYQYRPWANTTTTNPSYGTIRLPKEFTTTIGR